MCHDNEDSYNIITQLIYSLLSTTIIIVSGVAKECVAMVVRPLLKKHGLDVSLTKNYSSVSHLSFLSKLLDKVV